jgi:hypothetical protein
MIDDAKLMDIAFGLHEKTLVRVRLAPGVQPQDGQPAFFVQGGKLAGRITTSAPAGKSAPQMIGTIYGSEMWQEHYTFAFIKPLVGKVDYGKLEMTVPKASALLGVRPAAFAARCSKSRDKTWLIVGGVRKQCSLAEPYPHFYAYRMDPRGRWHVTMFAKSAAMLVQQEGQ